MSKIWLWSYSTLLHFVIVFFESDVTCKQFQAYKYRSEIQATAVCMYFVMAGGYFVWGTTTRNDQKKDQPYGSFFNYVDKTR